MGAIVEKCLVTFTLARNEATRVDVGGLLLAPSHERRKTPVPPKLVGKERSNYPTETPRD